MGPILRRPTQFFISGFFHMAKYTFVPSMIELSSYAAIQQQQEELVLEYINHQYESSILTQLYAALGRARAFATMAKETFANQAPSVTWEDIKSKLGILEISLEFTQEFDSPTTFGNYSRVDRTIRLREKNLEHLTHEAVHAVQHLTEDKTFVWSVSDLEVPYFSVEALEKFIGLVLEGEYLPSQYKREVPAYCLQTQPWVVLDALSGLVKELDLCEVFETDLEDYGPLKTYSPLSEEDDYTSVLS